MKKRLIVTGVFVALILAAAIIPIASHSSTKGCQIAPENQRVIRHSLIRGETLAEIKRNDAASQQTHGCTPNQKHLLYIL